MKQRSVVSLAQALHTGGIHRGVTVPDRQSALALVAARIGLPEGVSRQRVLEGLMQTEEGRGTGLSVGVAMPHARSIDGLRTTVAALFLLRTAVDWRSLDGTPTSILMVRLANDPAENLLLAAGLGRLGLLWQCGRRNAPLQIPDTDETISEQAREIDAAQAGPSSWRAQVAPPSADTRRLAAVLGPLGVHTRPAAALAHAVKHLDVTLTLEVTQDQAGVSGAVVHFRKGDSVLDLMRAALPGGSRLLITCTGPDAEPAMQAIREVLLAPGPFSGTSVLPA